jgi:putative DNA primase/helicase
MNFANVPAELLNRSQWTNWKYETRKGKPTKPPCDAQGNLCDAAKDPPAKSFVQALADLNMSWNNGGTLAGLGFTFTADDPYCGVDLDKCRNDKTGALAPWSQAIVEKLASYTEVSPSGTGVKIFLRGKLPGSRNRKDRIEMYDQARFFTVTGQHVADTPTTVEERQQALEELYRQTFGEEKPRIDEHPPPAVTGNSKLDHLMAGRLAKAEFNDA